MGFGRLSPRFSRYVGVTQADPPRARELASAPRSRAVSRTRFQGRRRKLAPLTTCVREPWEDGSFRKTPPPPRRRHAPCGASGFALHHQRHGAALPHSHQHTRRERNHAVDTPRSSRRHRCRGLLSLGGNYLGALAPSHYCLARAIYISNGIVSSKMRKPAMESR